MTISEEIIKVLDALSSKLGLAIDWTAENVMPYAQELIDRYVNFEIATSIFYIILWILMTIIGILIVRYAAPKARATQYDPEQLPFWVLTIGVVWAVIFCVVSIIVTAVQCMDIITCLVLPEKLIIDRFVMLRP